MTVTVPSAKHPEARLTYTHSLREALLVDGVSVGDTIINLNSPDVSKRPQIVVTKGDATLVTFVLDGSTLRYVVSGGTRNTWFRVAVWTANGRRLVEDIILKIEGATQ